MAKTIKQGTVKGARRRGRYRNRWEDNIKDGYVGAVEDRVGWIRIVEMCGAPKTIKVKVLKMSMKNVCKAFWRAKLRNLILMSLRSIFKK